MPAIDPGRLHVLTDEVLQTRHTHAGIARLAVRGGADTIQFREKRAWTTRALIDAAQAVVAECRAAGTRCVIDDRVDVAAGVGADGVHLGRDDLPLAHARRLLGPTALVGGTANSLDEARALWRQPLDYLGVGPVYGTCSKAAPAPPLGLAALRAIAAESPVPVIAIGNITPARVGEVLAAGAYGVAVLAAVTCADDPARAARAFREAIVAALAVRDGAHA